MSDNRSFISKDSFLTKHWFSDSQFVIRTTSLSFHLNWNEEWFKSMKNKCEGHWKLLIEKCQLSANKENQIQSTKILRATEQRKKRIEFFNIKFLY